MILPPSHRDTNTFFTGNVPPLGMFCMLGSAPLNLPVEVLCCRSLTCKRLSGLVCVRIPSTNEDRYVSIADNRCTLLRKATALSIFLARAIPSRYNKFFLFVLKPLALIHLTFDTLNFNPAIVLLTEVKVYPMPVHILHLLDLANSVPSFFTFLIDPVPLQVLH